MILTAGAAMKQAALSARNIKLLLINQYYWPDMAATAQLLTDLAEDCAEAGWKVTVLAGRGTYVRPRSRRPPARETRRAVAIRRVWCTDFGRRNMFSRLSDYMSFLLTAGAYVLFGPRYNVVLCLTTPPLVAGLGLIAKHRGSRFVYKVEDLYPDVAVALGSLRSNSLVSRLLKQISRKLLRNADAVVALDEAMRDELLSRGARQVDVIPNWADGQAIYPDPEAGDEFRREHGLGSRFVVLYAGNLGLAHRFDATLEAAELLQQQAPDVLFLYVGGGAQLTDIQEATNRLENVRVLPYQSRSELQRMYNAADLHHTSLREEVAGLLVPSKYMAGLAAGKAVLLIGGRESPLWREVNDRELGWTCSHNPSEIVRAILIARKDPQRLLEPGRRCRAVFDAKYSRRRATNAWANLLGSFRSGLPSDSPGEATLNLA